MKRIALFVLSTFGNFMLLSSIGCVSAATPEATSVPEMAMDNETHTIAEIEKLSGLNVSEPSYLPSGVSFEFATYQDEPSPLVTLQFKLVHEQYGDMGRFFQISQEPQSQAPAETIGCGETVTNCEVLQVGDKQVVYHLYEGETEGVTTEGLDWHVNGFTYRLLRMAGEPNEIYKDELIKIVESIQ